jgi:hypothetical protein
MSARASAARCCSPPESSLGRWFMRALQANAGERFARQAVAFRPRSISAKRRGSSTFSASVMLAIRLNDWKTIPTVRRRYPASSSRENFARSRS